MKDTFLTTFQEAWSLKVQIHWTPLSITQISNQKKATINVDLFPFMDLFDIC